MWCLISYYFYLDHSVSLGQYLEAWSELTSSPPVSFLTIEQYF